jgi:hypothetical protein
MMPLSLLIFSYLQILDLMSTVAFMMLGVREANPLIRLAFSLGYSPLAGLLLVKLTVVLLGVCCWLGGRERALARANLLFAFVVAWNLAIVIATAAQIG